MRNLIVTAVFSIVLSTSAMAEENQFRFEFLNEEGTEALGVGHGNFSPDVPETITVGDSPQFDTSLRLTRIGITINGTNGSAGYEHFGFGNLTDDLYDDTWLNTDDQKGAGYSDGTVRTDGSWRFGTTEDRNLTLNFNDHTWTQDTMESQEEGEDPVQVKSNGIFRLKMMASNVDLPGLDEVLTEDTASNDDLIPAAPDFDDGTPNIFDNTAVNNIVEEAKAAEKAKSNKSGNGALGFGFLALLALPMAIRRRRSNA